MLSNTYNGAVQTTKAADMAAFDSLPPGLREILRDQATNVSAVKASHDLRLCGEATLVRMLVNYREVALERWRTEQRTISVELK